MWKENVYSTFLQQIIFEEWLMLVVWLAHSALCSVPQITVPLNTSTASVLQFALGEYKISTDAVLQTVNPVCQILFNMLMCDFFGA